MFLNRLGSRLACAAALFAWTCAALAQDWPTRPLRWVVALPAGSAADLVARVVAAQTSARLKQPVIVENRPGASENIGMEHVAHAAPDGHTFLVAVSSLVTNPHLFKLRYDPMRELIPVSQIARGHFILVARPSLPATSVPELLALARANPGTITCAHASGALHIGCAWLRTQPGMDLTLVPYAGNVPALNDVVAGRTDITFAVVQTAIGPANANRVRALATTNPRRGHGPFGNLPTLAESFRGFEIVAWIGLMAPAGTPPHIVSALDREIDAVLKEEETRRRLGQGGLEVAHEPPAAFAEIIQRDYAKYEKVIRKSGIKVE
jgi:tripartite-type tricarboxylate transporter receptor subunit TctC